MMLRIPNIPNILNMFKFTTSSVLSGRLILLDGSSRVLQVPLHLQIGNSEIHLDLNKKE